jgi:hypothetical protein
VDPVERPSPFLPVFLAWLVPGAGHLKIGRLWPGVFTFSAILPLYVGGMALAGFENVSWERHPIYFWALHVFCGALTGAAAMFTRHVELVEAMPDQSVGMLFTAVASLLNVIAISDVWSRCRRGDPEARAKARMEQTAQPTTAPAPEQAPASPPAATEASGG